MPTHRMDCIAGARVAGSFGGITVVSVRRPDQGVLEPDAHRMRPVSLLCSPDVEFVATRRHNALSMSSLPTTPGTRLREPLIARPLIVLGAPRSGTTMVFQALSTHPDLWS